MTSTTTATFIGRQPILDRQRKVVAYELLFRNAGENEAHITDPFAATRRVVELAFRRQGLSTVLGGSRAFVNVDEEFLLSRLVEGLPPERVVLEVLETVRADEHILRRCRQLKAKGYRLALDDFYREDTALAPLLELADVVKVDLSLLDAAGLADLVRRLRPRPLRLLAEKVDSAERVRRCRALGFQLFQGFHFGRPSMLAA
jgi:EAL and modified HD-GYP domain-containing signal transduction protein